MDKVRNATQNYGWTVSILEKATVGVVGRGGVARG